MTQKNLNSIFELIILISFSSLIYGQILKNIEKTQTLIPPRKNKDLRELRSADTDFSSVIKTTNPTDFIPPTPEISTNDSEMTNKNLPSFKTVITSIPTETESNSNNPSFSDRTIFTTTDLVKTSAPSFSTQTYPTTLPSEKGNSTTNFSEKKESTTIEHTNEEVSTKMTTPFTTEELTTQMQYPSTTEEVSTQMQYPSTTEELTTQMLNPSTTEELTTQMTTPFTTEELTTQKPSPFTTEEVSTQMPTPFTTENVTSINEPTEIISTYANFTEYTTPSTNHPIVSTLIYNETFPTTPTIPSINMSVIETIIQTTTEIYPDASLILLGFSHFKKFGSHFSFYIYFSSIKGSTYSKKLSFPVQITYNNFLRLLQNQEANCTKIGEFNQKITYECDILTGTQNTNKIKIIPDFTFISQNAIVTLSPLSTLYMDNIQTIGEQLDILLNSSLYILSHSKINNNKCKSFNISSVINGPKPKFNKSNIYLKANIEDKNITSETELSCNIVDIINDNYVLKCEVNEKKIYILQNAISIIDDEILLVNFDDYENSKLNCTNTEPPESPMGAGAVIAIIVITIFFSYLI